MRGVRSRFCLVWVGYMLALGGAAAPCWAAESGLNLSLHANSKATADDIGLPAYPGAVLDTDNSKDDDPSTDLGFSFGDFQFSVVRVAYATRDSPQQVLEFYRKAMATYGDVLECQGGKAVGKLTSTRLGLRCADDETAHGSHIEINSSDTSPGHDLRAGSARHFRVMSLDDGKDNRTHFELVFIKLPKDK